MVKKYKIVKMPIEAYKGFIAKKQKMEERIKGWTGKEVNIKMTNVYRVVAEQPVILDEQKVIRVAKGNIRRVRKLDQY